jgi:hypothetical protein
LIRQIREAKIPAQNKGLTLIGQSNGFVNVAFSAQSGMGERVPETGFWEAIGELVNTGFLQPLDEARRRYKLVEVDLDNPPLALRALAHRLMTKQAAPSFGIPRQFLYS